MARIAVDGNYIFDNDINSLCDAVAGNGVISGLAVTEKGAGADMSVDVALGVYVANGTAVTKSGTTNVVVTAAHATLPRKDIIIGDSSGNLTCVAGTPYAASPSGNSGPQTETPVPPDITANKIILAEIWVPAAATTIINSYITDRRIIVTLSPGLLDNTAGGTDGVTTKAPTSNALYDVGVSKISHSLATAANDFLVASGSGAYIKKTLAETLTILGKAAASGLASLDASSVVVEAAVKSKLLYPAARDMTTASGDVAYTGVGFTPRALVIFAGVYTAVAMSWGAADVSRAMGVIIWTSAASESNSNAFVVYLSPAGGAYQTALVKSYDADGFTLTWEKTGSPTGSAYLVCLCLK